MPVDLLPLRGLQTQRQFAIVSANRLDRSCDMLVAMLLGLEPTMPKGEQKPFLDRAAALRKAVEEAGGGRDLVDDQKVNAPADCSKIILDSAAARASFDKRRTEWEKMMRRMTRSLPVWDWAKGVKGLGDLYPGIILGITGDLSGYATKEKVWKRLGLAVIGGIRQQRVKGAAAEMHGYSPQRRAEVWVVGECLMKHQWHRAKDDAPAGPCGPYGVVYARRKAHTATREWTPKHRDNDARRIMTKALVEDLWRVWRGLAPLATIVERADEG